MLCCWTRLASVVLLLMRHLLCSMRRLERQPARFGGLLAWRENACRGGIRLAGSEVCFGGDLNNSASLDWRCPVFSVEVAIVTFLIGVYIPCFCFSLNWLSFDSHMYLHW